MTIRKAGGEPTVRVGTLALSGAADTLVYDVCRQEQRVLVTLDHDFGHALRFPPEATAGIAVLECRGRLSPAAIRSRISDLVAALATTSIDGALWIVEPGRVRIRQRGP